MNSIGSTIFGRSYDEIQLSRVSKFINFYTIIFDNILASWSPAGRYIILIFNIFNYKILNNICIGISKGR